MELEYLADAGEDDGEYEIPLVTRPENPATLDWGPMIESLLAEMKRGTDAPRLARRFHRSLAAGIVKVARASGKKQVGLSGGCFQDRILAEGAVQRLRAGGFRADWDQRIPPNDGGIALGQLAAAGRILSRT